jgi:hypothetical protein
MNNRGSATKKQPSGERRPAEASNSMLLFRYGGAALCGIDSLSRIICQSKATSDVSFTQLGLNRRGGKVFSDAVVPLASFRPSGEDAG